MLAKLFVSLVLLVSVSANASQEIKPLQTRAECTIANTPDYFPFQPRPVLDAYRSGNTAAVAINAMENVSNSLIQTAIGGVQQQKVQVLSVEAYQDAAYPTDGCSRSATLKAVGVFNPATRSMEYGEVCEFSYNCIDNR
jgi:hypothetical protein